MSGPPSPANPGRMNVSKGPVNWRRLSIDAPHFYRQLEAAVDVTPLFSLRENAIAKEPGLGYPERWRCVSRLGLFNGGLDPFEPSPYVTLSRGAFSAPSLVTPTR